jgi:hypothetical protein
LHSLNSLISRKKICFRILGLLALTSLV